MTNYQLSAGGLYIPPGSADGAYMAHKAGARFTEFLEFVSGTNTTVTLAAGTVQVDVTGGVQGITAGDLIAVDNTDPTHPVLSGIPLVPLTTSINGVPDLVWDADDQMVLTEVRA